MARRAGVLATPLRYLPLAPAQLSLAAVLRNGQCFLWKVGPARATVAETRKAPESASSSSSLLHEWSYGCKDRTIVLRQDSGGIHYRALFPQRYEAAHAQDVAEDTTLAFLLRYFVLDTSLPELYDFWSKRDPNFAAKTASGARYGGIRILRQPTWECLIEFICSSNNNISRIDGMLKRLCRLFGERLPSAATWLDDTNPTPETEEEEMYAFPPPERLLGDGVTSALRSAGFGYRDAYVTKTAALACEFAEEAGFKDPEAYLETLSSLPEAEAKESLLRFAGVGPKVADCILLFGLGFEDVVPVDTHVYQIAVRDYGLKGSRDATVSKAMYLKVREKLQNVWGTKAGWAHQILFTADLAAFADFEDPLLVIKTEQVTEALLVKTEATTIAVKQEARIELLSTPAKKRKAISPSSSSARKLKRVKSEEELVEAVSVRQNPSAFYPTPPETPTASSKVDYFASEDTPLSLAERVKRGRVSRRAGRV